MLRVVGFSASSEMHIQCNIGIATFLCIAAEIPVSIVGECEIFCLSKLLIPPMTDWSGPRFPVVSCLSKVVR